MSPLTAFQLWLILLLSWLCGMAAIVEHPQWFGEQESINHQYILRLGPPA